MRSGISCVAVLAAMASVPSPVAAQDASANALSGASTSAADFGQNQTDLRSGSRDGGFGGNAASPWDRTTADAFQMGERSGRFGGGRPANLESLFEMGSKLSGDLGKAVGGNGNAVGRALGAIPKLDQLERNGLKFPVGSSAGKFQFAYHDQLGANGNAMGGGIGRGSAQATYSTSGLKNDMMHFSASAMFGGSGGMGGGMGPGMGSGMGSSGLSGGAFSSGGSNGMFSVGGTNGAGIGSGSGSMGGFSSGGMHGGMGPDAGGMHGGEGGHGKGGGETTPAVSLKLTFK